ncbi:DUF4912 domain-containing protein [Paenibacillus sp. SYP-B3998]|uniref:DUF4912 domain-containing protein n=1 Tax=Paenibacillus sp. SYP-B3998 TaxID=2678564 RepID=A0A6G3ZYL9_9BACL|nr:DUF4912 domain-containing protein [Paenibacillus sp. SYP-B3998]
MSPISTQALSLDHPDRDTLHLLVQSPSVLFVYWQLSARKRDMIQEHFGFTWQSLHPTLRVYDITGLHFDGSTACEVSELPLPQGESCFLHGFHQGRVYIADLGILNDRGQFLPILRSNKVESPLSAPHVNQDQLRIGQLPPLTFRVITPEAYEHFSAYSVYIPKAIDREPGGDSD